MKTISILGSGWLGYPLARQLIAAGHIVKASTRSENRIPELETIGAEAFIVDTDSLCDDITNFLRADILVVNIPSKNLDGFRNLIDAVKASELGNVLFVSSTSVYENIKTTITESDTGYYSRSPLLAIEDLFVGWGGSRVTIVRFGGLIGYRRHPGRFFRSGKVVQNPDTPVNLIHRDDCIGILGEIFEQQAWGEVFNCCADTHPTKREFYTRAAELAGGKAPAFGASDSGSGKIISNEKVKRWLNYEFKYPDLMQIEFEEST